METSNPPTVRTFEVGFSVRLHGLVVLGLVLFVAAVLLLN